MVSEIVTVLVTKVERPVGVGKEIGNEDRVSVGTRFKLHSCSIYGGGQSRN